MLQPGRAEHPAISTVVGPKVFLSRISRAKVQPPYHLPSLKSMGQELKACAANPCTRNLVDFEGSKFAPFKSPTKIWLATEGLELITHNWISRAMCPSSLHSLKVANTLWTSRMWSACRDPWRCGLPVGWCSEIRFYPNAQEAIPIAALWRRKYKHVHNNRGISIPPAVAVVVMKRNLDLRIISK